MKNRRKKIKTPNFKWRRRVVSMWRRRCIVWEMGDWRES